MKLFPSRIVRLNSLTSKLTIYVFGTEDLPCGSAYKCINILKEGSAITAITIIMSTRPRTLKACACTVDESNKKTHLRSLSTTVWKTSRYKTFQPVFMSENLAWISCNGRSPYDKHYRN